jgi:hypothetical protein
VADFLWDQKRLLLAKIQDEMKALQLCQSKVRQKKLPMEVIDAEYQWYVLYYIPGSSHHAHLIVVVGIDAS